MSAAMKPEVVSAVWSSGTPYLTQASRRSGRIGSRLLTTTAGGRRETSCSSRTVRRGGGQRLQKSVLAFPQDLDAVAVEIVIIPAERQTRTVDVATGNQQLLRIGRHENRLQPHFLDDLRERNRIGDRHSVRRLSGRRPRPR